LTRGAVGSIRANRSRRAAEGVSGLAEPSDAPKSDPTAYQKQKHGYRNCGCPSQIDVDAREPRHRSQRHVFLKLFERIYAPLTAGLLKPFAGDRNLAPDKRCQLDRLYQRLTDDLDTLLSAVGLKTAA
jgi:hypothetical protein